jgi:hypothetical protein
MSVLRGGYYEIEQPIVHVLSLNGPVRRDGCFFDNMLQSSKLCRAVRSQSTTSSSTSGRVMTCTTGSVFGIKFSRVAVTSPPFPTLTSTPTLIQHLSTMQNTRSMEAAIPLLDLAGSKACNADFGCVHPGCGRTFTRKVGLCSSQRRGADVERSVGPPY